MPFQESKVWRRNAVRFRHLDELFRRVQALEKDFKS
jgi:UDP-3-O-[3-hydroxymyristoyl] glucosamine N-acyltransferase